MKKLLYFLMITSPLIVGGQESLSLDTCYQLALSSSPLSENIQLLNQKLELERGAVRTARLPQFDLSAQATYQSDVTAVPVDLPNLTIETVPKDQYKAILQVNESIYDGGEVGDRLAVLQAENDVSVQQIRVLLHQQKLQVNQYFFGALLSQERIHLLEERRKMIIAREKQVQSGVSHGVLDETHLADVQVELLKIEQLITEAEHQRSRFIQSLRNLIGLEAGPVKLVKPQDLAMPGAGRTIERPEMELFSGKKSLIRTSAELINGKNTPKLFAFAQLGYGNPALNMLEDEFNPFYLVGAKFQWTPFDWNRSKKEVQSLNVQAAMVEREQVDFVRKINIELDRLRSQMDELHEMLAIDREIIRMRETIRKKSEVRLEQGDITTADYIDTVTDLYEARNLLIIHEIDFLRTKSNYLITKGN